MRKPIGIGEGVAMRLERILAALKAGQPVVHRTTRRAIKHARNPDWDGPGGGSIGIDVHVTYANTNGSICESESVDSRDIVRLNFRGDDDVAKEIEGAIIDVLNNAGIDGPLPPISVKIDTSEPPFFTNVKSIHD